MNYYLAYQNDEGVLIQPQGGGQFVALYLPLLRLITIGREIATRIKVFRILTDQKNHTDK
jgi:hypothetical protein